jgi:hypothetical protein
VSVANSEDGLGTFDVAVMFNDEHRVARSSLLDNSYQMAMYKYENEPRGGGIRPSLVAKSKLELDEMIAVYKLDYGKYLIEVCKKNFKLIDANQKQKEVCSHKNDGIQNINISVSLVDNYSIFVQFSFCFRSSFPYFNFRI